MKATLFKQLSLMIIVAVAFQFSATALAEQSVIITDKASYNPGETVYISINETGNVTAHIIDPLNRLTELTLTPSEDAYLTEYSPLQGVVLGTYIILVSGEQVSETCEFDIRTLSINTSFEQQYPLGEIFLSGNITDAATQAPVNASVDITIGNLTISSYASDGVFSANYSASSTGQKVVTISAIDNQNITGTATTEFEVYAPDVEEIESSTPQLLGTTTAPTVTANMEFNEISPIEIDPIDIEPILLYISGYVSPTDNSGICTDPTNAYADEGGNSSFNETWNIYSGYNFNLPANATILAVNVKIDAMSTYPSEESPDSIKLQVSCDGGSTWLTQTQSQELTNSQASYLINVKDWTEWTPDKINNDNIQVKVEDIGNNTVELDWIPILITYVMETNQAPVLTTDPIWWNEDYQYRQNIVIDAASSNITSGYSASITFNHSNMVDDSRSTANGDDLRVLYWNDSNWIELDRILDESSSWNNASTKIWIKTQKEIAAASASNDYFMYYGNSSATNPHENADNVYLFYDDFETLNTSKWQILQYSMGISDGILIMYPASSIFSGTDDTFGVNTTWETKVMLGGDGTEQYFNYFTGCEDAYYAGDWIGFKTESSTHVADTSTLGSTSFTADTPTQFHEYRFNREDTSRITFYQDGVEVHNLTSGIPTGNLSVLLWNNYQIGDGDYLPYLFTMQYDWVKVREYVSSEPSLSLDLEEGISTLSSRTLNETESMSIIVNATDPDDDSITYGTNATFGTLTSNVFTWTPGIGDAGVYYVEFTASDGSLEDNEVVSITVNSTNNAPVLTYIGPQTINESESLTITLNATDSNNDAITYATNATFGNLSENVFIWTTDYDDSGIYYVEFNASDGSLVDSEVVIITVNNTNREPVLSITSDNMQYVAPAEAWNLSYGGSSSDYAYSVKQTDDDGYVIVGQTSSFGAGSSDAWMIKTDANGIEEFNKTYGGSSSDYAYSVKQTNDNGYIVAGKTSSFGAGSSDAWMIKTDTNGTEEWNQTFGRNVDDYARSVMQTDDGGYAFAGRTSLLDESYQFKDYAWMVKTDSNGIEEWNQTFGDDDGSDYAYSIMPTSDSGYIIAGETSSFGKSNRDAWLIKTDANGNEEWNQTFDGYDGSYSDEAHSAKQTDDGGYIIAGEKTNLGGSISIWLIKTDSNGNMIWNQTFGNQQSGKMYDVWATNDGGYIITGNTESSTISFKYDGYVLKTDSQGNELWNKTVGGSDNDYLYSLTMTDDDEFIAVGEILHAGEWYTEAWMVKLEAESFFVEVNESKLLTITLNATDIDGDSITYNTNATFGTLADNVFTWTPDYDDNGIYYVEFNVYDGSIDDTEIVTLTVNNVITEFINLSTIRIIEPGTSINSFNITLNQTSLVDFNMTDIRVYGIVPVNFTISDFSPSYNDYQNNTYYWNLNLTAGESKNITYVLTGTGEYHVTNLFNKGAGHS